MDEDFAPEVTNCGKGLCASTGVTLCAEGVVQSTCEAGEPAGLDDECDGIDQDCDGNTDEHFMPVQTTCGTGACASGGVMICMDGQVIDTCTPGSSDITEDATCDGIDDDCDGLFDEDFTEKLFLVEKAYVPLRVQRCVWMVRW